MIEKLIIKNFQSHKNTELEFSNGVNCIVGGSDSGKSAIIKALRWVAWNRPLGADFKSWEGVNDGEETSVKIVTEQGTIIRSKGKEEEYQLKITGKKDLPLKAFKTNVPDEITALLDLNETNLQQQFDSHFLLSESPGAVANHFNKVAHLSVIDIGTANVNSWIRDLTSDIKYKEGQEISLQEELKKFDYLDAFETEVVELEILEVLLNNKQADKTKLEKLLSTIFEITNQIEEEEKILKAEPLLNEIFKDIKLRNELRVQSTQLENLINNIREIQEKLNEQEKILIVEPLVTQILKLYDDRKALLKDKMQLTSLLNKIKDNQKDLEAAEQYLERKEKEFKENFPNICPLCNKPK